jgi:hypothetical protein
LEIQVRIKILYTSISMVDKQNMLQGTLNLRHQLIIRSNFHMIIKMLLIFGIILLEDPALEVLIPVLFANLLEPTICIPMF